MIRNRFNLISEERVNNFKQNSKKPDENQLKNKEVMTLEVLQIFKKHFLTSRYEYANE